MHTFKLLYLSILILLATAGHFAAYGDSTELQLKASNAEDAEAWAKQFAGTTQHKTALIELANYYYESGKLQEAIWTHRLAQNNVTAERIQQELIGVLKNVPYQLITQMGFADIPLQVKLNHNGKEYLAVLKFGPAALNETLAFVVDRHMGLNIVPTTVRLGNNISLQIFLEAKHDERLRRRHSDLKNPNLNFREFGYPAQFFDMWVLDYTLNAWDRHGANWMYRAGGHYIAIDNSRLLGIGEADTSSFMAKRLSPVIVNDRIYDWLNITAADLRAEIPDISREHIDTIIRSIRTMAIYSGVQLYNNPSTYTPPKVFSTSEAVVDLASDKELLDLLGKLRAGEGHLPSRLDYIVNLISLLQTDMSLETLREILTHEKRSQILNAAISNLIGRHQTEAKSTLLEFTISGEEVVRTLIAESIELDFKLNLCSGLYE